MTTQKGKDDKRQSTGHNQKQTARGQETHKDKNMGNNKKEGSQQGHNRN